MSLWIAVETATDAGSVAIGEPGTVLHEVAIEVRRHAAETMPAVVGLLRRAGVGWDGVSGFVFADGPGSFTGLRIGLGTVKGIAAAHPCLSLRSVPSLLGAAWTARERGSRVAALYDALRGEVFLGMYDFGTPGVVRTILEPALVAVSDLGRLPAPDVAVGDGAIAHAADVRQWTGRAPPPLSEASPSARALLELMAVPGIATPVSDIDRFEPAYGRRAAAQDRWEEKHGRPLPDPSGS